MAFTYQQLSQPTRTEVSDSQGWAATFTNGSRTVLLRGQSRTFTELSPGITDDFSRTIVDGWGGTPNGGRWYNIGGTPSLYQATGTKGTIQVTTANIAHRMFITNPHIDINASIRMQADGDTGGLGIQQGLIFGYKDSNNYYMATMSVVAGDVSDTFARTAANGWGTATSGQSWTTCGGTTADYSVSGGSVNHTIATVNSSLRTLVSAGADFDCKVKVATDAVAQGSSMLAGIIARYQDTNNYYNFRIRFSSAPSTHPLYICIQKQQAGAATTLSPEVNTGVLHTPGSYVWIRATGSGTTLRMKLWADGAVEPAAWPLTITDSSFTAAGQAGLRSLVSAGNTNPLPVTISYRSFTLSQLNTNAGSTRLSLLKRSAGVTKTLSSTVLPSVSYASGTGYWLRVMTQAGLIQSRLWREGASEPADWAIHYNGTTSPKGNIGLRAYCSSEAPALPVTFSFDTYRLTGTWVDPPVVSHGYWVRLLPASFNGAVDEGWLTARLADSTVDILAQALQYVTYAPPVVNGDGLQIAGDSGYSSLYPPVGDRRSGGDFNDYLGADWRYSSTSTDNADPLFLRCMDCAGFVRMVFGYRSGYPLGLSASTVKLPRTSYNLAYSAPGTVIASNDTAPPSLAGLSVGDMLYFCKPTGDPNAAESQVDHVGIYVGTDVAGHPRFISSRRAINGPTIADIGGPSTIDGIGQYATTLRLIRRL